MCWTNAGHSWALQSLGYCPPRECCPRVVSLHNQKVRSGNIKRAEHATLASLGIWWICTCPGFFLTTAILWSTAWLQWSVFGLKRSSLQNRVRCFPPASWPLSRGDLGEPLYEAATVCPLDLFPIRGNGRETPNVTDLWHFPEGEEIYVFLSPVQSLNISICGRYLQNCQRLWEAIRIIQREEGREG